jgi:hypothetical protein
VNDLLQAFSMFAFGGLLGALAYKATRSDSQELQRMIDGQPKARRAWERREPRTGTMPEPAPAPTRRYAFSIPSATAPETRNAAPGEPWTVQTLKPHRDPTPAADVAVPALQATITATVGALLLLAIALLAMRAPWQDALRAGGLAWAALLAGAWLWRLHVVDGILQEIERIIGRDLTGDGMIGRAPHTVLLDPDQARHTIEAQRREAQDAGELAALLAFVDKCFVSGTSERAHGAKPNTTAREQYIAHRDTLLRLGLAAWRNEDRPTAGWILTTSRQKAHQVIAAHIGEI